MSKYVVGAVGVLRKLAKAEYPARIIANDLNSRLPVIVAWIDNYGQERIIGMTEDYGTEDGNWHFFVPAIEDKYVSYLFADGTATAFKPAGGKYDLTKPYVAVVKAVKVGDKYTKHELVRVDQSEEEMQTTSKVEEKPDFNADIKNSVEFKSITSLEEFEEFLTGLLGKPYN